MSNQEHNSNCLSHVFFFFFNVVDWSYIIQEDNSTSKYLFLWQIINNFKFKKQIHNLQALCENVSQPPPSPITIVGVVVSSKASLLKEGYTLTESTDISRFKNDFPSAFVFCVLS